MSSSAQSQPIPGSPASVLAAARTHQEWIRQGEAALLVDAVEWASTHEPVGDAAAASWWVHGHSIELAGEGAPQVTEDAVAEFAAAVGMSSDQGRRYLGHAIEIAYRLPTVYKQVKAGTTPVWRARRIAEHTMCLPPLARRSSTGPWPRSMPRSGWPSSTGSCSRPSTATRPTCWSTLKPRTTPPTNAT